MVLLGVFLFAPEISAGADNRKRNLSRPKGTSFKLCQTGIIYKCYRLTDNLACCGCSTCHVDYRAWSHTAVWHRLAQLLRRLRERKALISEMMWNQCHLLEAQDNTCCSAINIYFWWGCFININIYFGAWVSSAFLRGAWGIVWCQGLNWDWARESLYYLSNPSQRNVVFEVLLSGFRNNIFKNWPGVVSLEIIKTQFWSSAPFLIHRKIPKLKSHHWTIKCGKFSYI